MAGLHRRVETPILVGKTLPAARSEADRVRARLAPAWDSAPPWATQPETAVVTAQLPRPGTPMTRRRVITVVLDGGAGDREPSQPVRPHPGMTTALSTAPAATHDRIRWAR